jgi:hypothetical protein
VRLGKKAEIQATLTENAKNKQENKAGFKKPKNVTFTVKLYKLPFNF